MPEGDRSRHTGQDFELDVLLSPEPQLPPTSSSQYQQASMGLDAEKPKPEGQRGDNVAFYGAMVRPILSWAS